MKLKKRTGIAIAGYVCLLAQAVESMLRLAGSWSRSRRVAKLLA